jgi:hypothetical protein
MIKAGGSYRPLGTDEPAADIGPGHADQHDQPRQDQDQGQRCQILESNSGSYLFSKKSSLHPLSPRYAGCGDFVAIRRAARSTTMRPDDRSLSLRALQMASMLLL